jgi:putative ABC transport system permease protein
LAHAQRTVGQSVLVTLPDQHTAQTMKIVGRAVFPSFGQGEVTPTGLGDGAAFLDSAPSPDGFNFFLVNMTLGARQQANIARLARDLSAAQVCPQDCNAVTRQRPADVNNYARITATPLILAGVLALLAAATVAHLLVTSIQRRRRDLAVLRALGFFRRQVSAAVACQATIVVTLALLVGLPLGIAAGRGAWIYFATRLGVAADPHVPLGAAILFIAATLLIANGIAAGPGWLAGRLEPGPVLRTE